MFDVRQTYVVPLTSNLDRAGLAGNVLLESAVTGLPKDSVAVPLGLESTADGSSTERVSCRER